MLNLVLVLLAAAPPLGNAFISPPSQLLAVGRPSGSKYRPITREMSSTNIPEEEDDDEITGLTPQMLKVLRKEGDARKKQKRLAAVFVDPEEGNDGLAGSFLSETLESIIAHLTESEMVEVRGLCKNDVKLVGPASAALQEAIFERKPDLDVFQIRRKGHAVLLFRPRPEEEEGPRIKFFTTRKTPWERKLKPVRDDDNLIIPGEYA